MDNVYRLASAVSRILALIGAIGVVLMMLHICTDVLLRNLFRYSLPVTVDVVSRYYMVAIAFLPLAMLEIRREMISVELIDFLLSRQLRRLSDILVCLVSSAIYTVLAYTTWIDAASNFRRGTFVELVDIKMPIWHSYLLPPIGFTIAALATILMAAAYAFTNRRTDQEAETA
jgi:TRAP-type C4-dicarboxylate transport system permease small subunit